MSVIFGQSRANYIKKYFVSVLIKKLPFFNIVLYFLNASCELSPITALWHTSGGVGETSHNIMRYRDCELETRQLTNNSKQKLTEMKKCGILVLKIL